MGAEVSRLLPKRTLWIRIGSPRLLLDLLADGLGDQLLHQLPELNLAGLLRREIRRTHPEGILFGCSKGREKMAVFGMCCFWPSRMLCFVVCYSSSPTIMEVDERVFGAAPLEKGPGATGALVAIEP